MINSGKLDVEARKNLFDLRPNLSFVRNNLSLYEDAVNRLLSRYSDYSSNWVSELSFVNEDKATDYHRCFGSARNVLSGIPDSLLRISICRKIDCVFYDNAQLVLIPTFDEKGVFTGRPDFIELNQFSNDLYFGRVLVGVSHEGVIYTTPLPIGLCEGGDFSISLSVIQLYQVHVLLHEFFHTVDVEIPKYRFRYEGEEWSGSEIFSEFDSLFRKSEYRPISYYAKAQSIHLQSTDHKLYQDCFREQIAEIFVGYMLNIISNPYGVVNIKSNFFEEWRLMNILCSSELVY